MTASDVQRVTRQIQILKQVHHPNVVQLYEIMQTPKQLLLVMEYVAKGELFDLITKKKIIRQPEACNYFRQLVAGIEYLHQLGVAHRDLKPENLLIDSNKTLKIVDFGLSNTYKPSNSKITQRNYLKQLAGLPATLLLKWSLARNTQV